MAYKKRVPREGAFPEDPLAQEIDAILADEQYEGHALKKALIALFRQYKSQQAKLERLVTISDGFQWMAREQKKVLADQHRKQRRQLTKITNISDRYQMILQQKNEELRIASTHDYLTNIPNRRFILKRITEVTAEAERTGKTYSLAIIDVDDFKAINDQYGHDVGDKVLIRIANALKERVRSQDVCARWGGEEFMIMLPQVPGASALRIAERLRSEAEQLLFEELSPPVRSSISIGVAEHRLTRPCSETIIAADKALYAAKRSGRNKVELAS